jgi:glycerophosphoryl diester phosphodiesterase
MLLDYFWINRWYPYSPKRIARNIKKYGLDGVNIWAGKIVTKEFIRRIKHEDLSVYLWVVNDPIKAKQFIDYGVDGISTDRAEWMRKEID